MEDIALFLHFSPKPFEGVDFTPFSHFSVRIGWSLPIGNGAGMTMLTKLFLGFSIAMLGAGGCATQSAMAIQRSAYSGPVIAPVAP